MVRKWNGSGTEMARKRNGIGADMERRKMITLGHRRKLWWPRGAWTNVAACFRDRSDLTPMADRLVSEAVTDGSPARSKSDFGR